MEIAVGTNLDRIVILFLFSIGYGVWCIFWEI